MEEIENAYGLIERIINTVMSGYTNTMQLSDITVYYFDDPKDLNLPSKSFRHVHIVNYNNPELLKGVSEKLELVKEINIYDKHSIKNRGFNMLGIVFK